MTRTQRRTKMRSGIVLAMALVFLLAAFALSLTFSYAEKGAVAEENYEYLTYVEVRTGWVEDYLGMSTSQQADCRPADGVVDTVGEFCFVFLSPVAGEYTLGANFKIVATNWSSGNPTIVNGCTLNGNNHVIWNAASQTNASQNGSVVGGLINSLQGVVRNLKYYYTGDMYVTKHGSSPCIAAGGFAGKVGYVPEEIDPRNLPPRCGEISNCDFALGGAVITESNTEGVTSYVGGFIGVIHYATSNSITSCNITASGVVEAYTDQESGSERAKHNIVYAGGVVGKMMVGTIQNCSIKSSAAIISADNTDKWSGTIGDIISVIGIDTSNEYNDYNHVHPAGVVVGALGQSGIIKNNEIVATGSAVSFGQAGSSNGGCIAGGFIGLLEEDMTTGAAISSNSIRLNCGLSAFWLEAFGIVDAISSWIFERDIDIYVGGLIGKCSTDKKFTFTNNLISIEKDNGIVEDGADFENETYDANAGLICGNDSIANLVGTNNWLVRKLAECNTKRIAGNNSPCGKLNHLNVFGDGEVVLRDSKITSSTDIPVKAKPTFSPFRGWTADITSVAPQFTTVNTTTLKNSSGAVKYAVFVDTEIASSGELTQFAKDVNLIMEEVWRYINQPNAGEDKNRITFPTELNTTTLSWLEANLTKDILVEDGTPVIENYYGKFNGNGHKISFAAGSKITHDWEQPNEDKSEKDEDKEKTIDYTMKTTGLFGTIMPGAIISDLKIDFGGSIVEMDGLKFNRKNTEDIGTLEDYYTGSGSDTVKSRTYDYATYTYPDTLSLDSGYVYFFKGDGYVQGRAMNPGYVELVPCRCEIVTDMHFVGVLCGANLGTIISVSVDSTKSAYIACSANNVSIGTLCGLNAGIVMNCSATFRGKALANVRAFGNFGGLIGNDRPSNFNYNGLSSFVAGEITIKTASDYHEATVYLYDSAVGVDLVEGESIPDGYTKVARDYTMRSVNSGSGSGATTVITEDQYYFCVKNRMGVETSKIYGNDTTAPAQAIGSLIGRYEGAGVTIANAVAVSGEKGSFNTPVYNADVDDAKVGALIGYVETATGYGIPTLSNCWAGMSYTEFDKGAAGRPAIGNFGTGILTGANLVYVQTAIVVPNLNLQSALPISFTLEAREGMTFSGWYDYTSGSRTVISTGLEGSVFTPQNQVSVNQIYVAELVNLQIFEEAEIKKIAASTNEGRGYRGVTFTLGTNITLNSHTPIGDLAHPFLGTFDGNGQVLTIKACSTDLIGLFGCVGTDGVVINLTVEIPNTLGNSSTFAAGAIAAVNYGTIGQDLSTGKVIANISGTLMAQFSGGLVGVNRNLVKNAEVQMRYVDEYSYGQICGVPGGNGLAVAGGAIGINQSEITTSIVKNVIVYFGSDVERSPVIATAQQYALGGVVGINDVGSAVYSVVSVVNDNQILNGIVGSDGEHNRLAGFIIGYNVSRNVDGLWCLYRSKKAGSNQTSAFGAPVKVYDGGIPTPTVTNQLVLVNGEECSAGNILIRYGRGNVDVSISGVESQKGGQITFFSSKASSSAVDFYDYVDSFEDGTRVSVTDGNNGYALNPVVGTASTDGLKGKIFYAAFCDSSIGSQEDYIAVRQNIANDYRLYVEYNITNSFSLDASETGGAIGTASRPFRGAINGNAYTVTLNSTASLHAFIGVLGENDGNHYSAIRNLRLVVQSGTFSNTTANNAQRGFLTDVNYGTVTGVNLTVRGALKAMNGYVGAVAGENRGVIESAMVNLEYANYLGVDGYGALLGRVVGGVVGVNYGVIGNGTANAIDVSISGTAAHRGVVYGTSESGAVVGRNAADGILRSAIVSVSGVLGGGSVSALAGKNLGMIEDGFVTVDKNARYFATKAFGLFAGENEGTVGIVGADFEPVIKGYIYAAPSYGESFNFPEGVTANSSTLVIGGAVGMNASAGAANGLLVELHAPIYASRSAGGLVGENEGTIGYSSLLSTERSDIVATRAGGFAATNDGTMNFLFGTLRGGVGSEVSGANGIVATAYAGGVFAFGLGTVSNSSIALYVDLAAGNAGLGAASCDGGAAMNTWVQVCNSSVTPASDTELSGFNVIRVLNETLLTVSVDYLRTQLTFTSSITGVKNWYTDISAWTLTGDGVLTEGLKTKLICAPAFELVNQTYFVCYDDLSIRNVSAFNNLATLINSRDYYNGVLFRLESDLSFSSGTVVRPIGTPEHPFNGIFDGGYRKITFRSGSGISGTEYTGLFGYTGESARIANFLLSLEEGASIGSVNSYEVGALVGRNQGHIENVFVNLSAKVTSNSRKRFAGAFVGNYISVNDNDAVNCWISILNEVAPAVGNMTVNNAFGVNYIGVLGNGATDVRFMSEYQPGTTEDVRVCFFVPTGEGGSASMRQRCEEYFRSFGGWFRDIRTGEKIIDVPGYESTLGSITYNPDDKDVSLIPIYAADNQKITLSFISLTIRNEDDFIRFAKNINTYGDQGARFSLLSDVTIDFENCESVGTAERPFTGEFNGNGYKISVVGSLVKREYAGVFGYVGVGGLVKNLYVDVTGENVKVGDNSTLYSGVAVALLFGEVKNVVVGVRADTVVYTTQGLASSGGIVGRAGKVGENGDPDISYKIDNSWLVLAENSTVTNPVGEDPDLSHPDYYRVNKSTCGEGRVMQMVGDGGLLVEIKSDGSEILFDANENGYDFYGFIDNNNVTDELVQPIHDGGITSSIFIWTVKPGDKDKNGNATSTDMLCVIINKYVGDVADLMKVSENVSKGRNYRGITYELTADIVLPTSGFAPIGGEVVTSSGSGYTNYIERDFIGGFNGHGHTITMPEGLVIDARYAGLFGRVGDTARIKDLTVEANCKIGYDTGENTTRTIYAGVLAAYATGGKYDNLVIVMNKRAALYGSVGTGRTFGYLPRTAGNVANNCWVISYNSRENYELNAAELLYNASFDKAAFEASGATPAVGANQGGVNNLMIVAAGDVYSIRQENDVTKYHFTYTGNSYWYALNEFSGDKKSEIGADGGSYQPSATASRLGYNVSFLNSEIGSVEALKAYAESINDGYNFYKLTFTVTADIEIGETDEFVSIGTEESGLNGSFDGMGHTITIAKDTVIGGKYAGLFGYVAENGVVQNLRVVVKGRLGNNGYTGQQVEEGAVNTVYAGVVAYNKGRLENLIVISDGATLRTLNGVSGIAIAYDETNLVKNVWALVDASAYLNAVGATKAESTGVNAMKIVGIGTVDATFLAGYQVKFISTSSVPVMGWYKSYEKNQQISSAMLSTGDLINGTAGYLVAPVDHFGVNYEVAVIKTVLENALELIALAEDVNIGGYSFESLTFSLGADIEIPTAESAVGYLPIGNEAHSFKGVFSGRLGSAYHKITVRSGYALGGLFGNNAGIIRDLTVVVKGTIGERTSSSDQVYGAIAAINNGRIESCFVDITADGSVVGYTVGGVVGRNNGTISDCVVVVSGTIAALTAQGNTVNAGGLVGVNYGVIEGTTDFAPWSARGLLPQDVRVVNSGLGFDEQVYDVEGNVFIYGEISAVATSQTAYANAGGAVGNNYAGTLGEQIVYLQDTGRVRANAFATDGARAGALAGYAHGAVNQSVVFLFGEVESDFLTGGSVGYLDGVTARNVWQVTLNRIVATVGLGSRSINSLNIKGNGKIKASIDTFSQSVMFTNITDDNGSEIGGWYTAPGLEVDGKTGNVGEKGNTFLPLSGVQNKYVMVVFVNTEIRSAADLVDMADSVSGGLSGEDITFTLMNDITVEANLLKSTIGTVEYPFNNIFDGQGYTITLKGGALAGEDYVALFGYTGQASKIGNLKLVVKEGVYGSERSERTAILAAYSEGSIKDVEITVEAGAEIVGNIAATLAATSFGSVDNVTLSLAGKVTAIGSQNTVIAGGLIAANDGTVSGIVITSDSASEVIATGAITAYAGYALGENYKAISSVKVLYRGKLTAEGAMTAYSGVVAGLNLGYVDRAYVEVDHGSFGAGVSGGLVGNNVNAVTTALVKIVDEVFAGSDAAIGYSKTRDTNKVHNVWVYSDKVLNVSRAKCVNSMTYDEGLSLSCPTAEEVLAGKIAFSSEITSLRDAVALFARIEEDVFGAGSGAAMRNVSYADGKIIYSAYDLVGSEATVRKVANVCVRLVTRDAVGSGSEFYALAQALNSGEYTFENAVFSLTADFDLPANSEIPEGRFPAMNVPSDVKFVGGHHVITVGDTTLTDGLFGENDGEISEIGIRLTKAESAGYLVKTNATSIRNAVVYLENGASVTGGHFFVRFNGGATENLWLVVRDDVALSQGVVPYSVIRINGVGTLSQGGGAGLTFTAASDEEMLFIGYTSAGAIFSAEPLFDTEGKETAIYTAEFISTYIDTDYKLSVLSGAAALGYEGRDVVFTLGADLTTEVGLFGSETVFLGTIEGAGYRITATSGVVGSFFGKFAGEIRNAVLDLSALSAGAAKLFDGANAVTLTHVVIVEERALLSVGAPVTAADVWFETENEALYRAFLDSSAYTGTYSLLYKNGAVEYLFDDGVIATAEDSDRQVFAGWYGRKGLVSDSVCDAKLLRFPALAGNVYMLNYINRTLAVTDDLVRLSTAVAGGFDFAGVTFLVADGGFTVNAALETIGDAEHDFKGDIKGGVNSTIRFANYGVEDSFAVRPFLYKLYGELSEIIFVYDEGAVFAGTPALVCENAGLMNAIVVNSKGANLFDNGAGLTLLNGGRIVGSWLITKGVDRAVLDGSLVGVNEMRVDSDTVLGVSFSRTSQGTKVIFLFDPIVGYFVCLYDYDGAVVFPGNYNYPTRMYTAPYTASGNKISVRSVNSISSEDELVYLGYLTSGANFQAGSVITLGADLVIERNLNAVISDGLIFDLAGHSITLAAPTSSEEVVFGKKVAAGEVRNGSIYLNKGYYGIGAAGLTLRNVTLFLSESGMALPSYKVIGTTVVTADRTYKDSLITASGDYTFLYAPKGASVRADYDDSNVRTFVGADNDLYYFGAIREKSLLEEEAFFAPAVIRTAADYKAFALASNYNVTNLAHAEISLEADVTVDGTVPSHAYAGVFLGGGHTVTAQGGAYADAFLTVEGEGSVTDLALAFKNCDVTTGRLIVAPDTSRVAVVVYQPDESKKQVEEGTRVVNVYGQGAIVTTFGEGITFTAEQSGHYALRKWTNAANETVNAAENGRANLIYAGGESVSAYFAVRYLVTVDFAGVSDEILTKNERNLPTFKGTGIYFADEIEPAHDPIVVEITNIGEGFLFRSMNSAVALVAQDGSNKWKFTISWTTGVYEIALTASLTYVEMIWESTTYNATVHAGEELSTLRSQAESLGYSVEYGYTPLGTTPPLEGAYPYHAGNYLVSFRAFFGGKMMCNAYCGLEIKKAILTFDSILIKDKDYDGTDRAEIVEGSLRLNGFMGDAAYVALDGLTFSFADANAEQGKLVYVAGDATLRYDATNDPDGSHRYVYLDYEFDPSSITSASMGLIRANIRRRTLKLRVESITVEYLDQFGDSAPVFAPTVESGLVDADVDAFNALAATLMTREKADSYDVGYYRIIVGDSLAFPNYNVVLTGAEAYYIVEPSEVKILFDEDEMLYGDKGHTPAYHVFVGEAGGKTYRAMADGDELYFTEVVYNDGGALLPGETRYSFTCLFSAENKNYYVEATEGYKIVGGARLAILSSGDKLKVLPKPLTVTADDSRNTKRFGKRSETPSASLGNRQFFVEDDHTLVVSREAGESVGRYLLTYSVKDASGADVTDRYDIKPANAAGYYFTITPVALRIKPSKTAVIYGTPVTTIKYGVSVEGGGITLADLYYALTGTEKKEVTLADVGIDAFLGYDTETILPVGEYDAGFDWSYQNEAARKNISNVTITNSQKMIVVQKRYLTITISDFKKTYNGEKDFRESNVKYTVKGLLPRDEEFVKVKRKGYTILGDGVSVGVYKIDGEFVLESQGGGNMADNYFITVVQGNFTIDPSKITIAAEVGYFDEQGTFTPATIERSGMEIANTIYYGDSRAELRFTVTSGGTFLKVPEGATDKEASDYIRSALKISYNKLNKLTPFDDDGKTTADVLGLFSANNNVKATFTAEVSIASVYLTIRLVSGEKVIGDVDPEIGYELIAQDPNDDYAEIANYKEISKGTFRITITGDRTEGEMLGTYTYSNVSVDIVNAGAGESLFDESTETGKAFSGLIENEENEITLSIKQPGFLKTTLGKWLIYGGIVLLVAVGVVLLIVLVPRAKKKRRARKAAEEKLFDPTLPDEGKDAATETPAEEGSDQPVDEKKE